jgi:hypothetical protein
MLTRRHVLAGAASVAAVAAMPAAAIAAVEQAPGPLSGGRTLHSGSFAPSAALGVGGDFYADAATGDMWHRSRGAWRLIFNYAESEMERAS